MGNRSTALNPSLGQISFSDLGEALADVDFVVVDLETTGGSPAECSITEIGAVRVRGGVVQGEFQTLVNPGSPIPPFIAALTGITDATVAGAPRIGAALPMFLEFARGSVLVAHNAGFDTGFLRTAARELDIPWPNFTVVDTARLARVLLHRDEVRNNKLATLAQHFGAATTPDHRALHDARATVDVLHGLLERAASFGATHLVDLADLAGRATHEQRKRRTLADGLPDVPGVYVFLGPNDETLYVGKSRSIRTRVRSYFTASEKRARILEMVRIARRVQPIPCASDLEAQIREIRLIAERQPPYNRRSRNPDKAVWLKLTAEPFPRLTVARSIGADLDRGARYVGPYHSTRSAEQAREAMHEAFPLRTCTQRLARSIRTPSCIAAELGTCAAPCSDVTAHARYVATAVEAAEALADPSPVVAALSARMRGLASAEEFEAAVVHRERLRQLLAGQQRWAEHRMLVRAGELVAARADGREWEVQVIRFGRLVGGTRVRPGDDPAAAVAAAVETAEDVAEPAAGNLAGLLEEADLILKWLWQPGVRLVRLSGELSLPIESAHRHLAVIAKPQPDPHRRFGEKSVGQSFVQQAGRRGRGVGAPVAPAVSRIRLVPEPGPSDFAPSA